MNPFYFSALALVGVCSTLAAFAPAQNAPEAGVDGRPARDMRGLATTTLTSSRHSRVHWDTDSEGKVWVRGRGYKASFGTEGATYFPLFGKEQPRHFPLIMSLASATSDGSSIALEPKLGVVREGQRVVFERGDVDEVYEIGLAGIEQTFVVESKPQGDLTLFVTIDTELVGQTCATGFEFSNEFGSVGYSFAFAREPDGKKHPLVTRLVEGGIEIDITAEYMSSIAFPLTVDPLISTFDVDLGGANDFASEVAYDLTTDHYLFVYEEGTDPFDGDAYARLMDGTGTILLDEEYIDITAENWYDPSVANLNAYDQFLVVGSSGVGPLGLVQGRVTSASSVLFAPKFTIANAGIVGADMVSVGGDPYSLFPSYYCVSWVQRIDATNFDIHARLVTNTGTLFGSSPLIVDGSVGTRDVDISVSHSNAASRWNLAWDREGTGIRGSQIRWDGALITPSFPISVSGSDTHPAASSPRTNGEYLVAWQRWYGTQSDILGALISGGTVMSSVSLTQLEGAAIVPESQVDARVDCDGEQFGLLYTNYTATGYRAYAASFHVLGGTIGVSEAHVPINWAPSGHAGDIYAHYSSGALSRKYAVAVYSDVGDVGGAFYQGLVGGPISPACFGDGSGTACPCGNTGSVGRGCGHSANGAGAQLVGSGQADLSVDTVVLTANGVPPGAPCLFFQGTSLLGGGSGMAFGDGLLCAGGTIQRLAVVFASGTSASFPGAFPTLSDAGAVPAGGGAYHYQVWYRDSAVFCSSSTNNLTNAVSVTWLP